MEIKFDFKKELKERLELEGCKMGIIDTNILKLKEEDQKELLEEVLSFIDYKDLKLKNGDIIEMTFLNYDTVDLIYTEKEDYIELCGEDAYNEKEEF